MEITVSNAPHRLAHEIKEGGLIFIQDDFQFVIVHMDKQAARKLLKEIESVGDKLLYHFLIWIWSLFHWAGFCRRFIVINTDLAGDLPSPLLQFPDNGVRLLGQFSFSTTSGSKQEPSFSLLGPFLRNHGRCSLAFGHREKMTFMYKRVKFALF